MINLKRFLPSHVHKHQDSQSMFVPIKEYNPDVSSFKASILLKEYDCPTRQDVLVILPFFNPCNSVRIVQNLLLVKSKLDACSIPYVIPHCLFPDSAPLMKPSRHYFTVKSNSYAFLKENLANIAIERSGGTFNKYAILDSDVLFENESWYNDLSSLLDNVDIVQPYTAFKSLGCDFHEVINTGVSIFSRYMQVGEKDKPDTEPLKGHTGYAIAFTRDFLNRQAYAEKNLIGGGDSLICSLALRRRLFAGHLNSKYYHWIYDNSVTDYQPTVGVLDGTVYHLYHNNLKNRQYMSRYQILSKYINDTSAYVSLDDIIRKNEDGVYEWIDEVRADLNRDILNYFASRQDDDVILTP